MRFDGIHVHNLGPFGDVQLDLSAIDGRIIAVAGENGAGKSTLLELLAGGLFRTTPTRGKLSELATDRDSFVEVRAVNGATYTIRHNVDAHNGKGESLVLDGEGAPILDDAKVRSFDRWAAQHLPAPEVFFSSIFAAQGSGGFLDMKPGDRKAVLLRTLGIEQLERVAEKAREHERETRQRLEVVQARLSDEQARGLDVEEAEGQLAAARALAAETDAAAAKARAELERVEGEARATEEAHAAHAGYLKRGVELRLKHKTAEGRVEDLERRIANNRRVLDDAERIRGAVAEEERLRTEIEELKAALDGAKRDIREHDRAARQWLDRQHEARRRGAAARERIQAAQRRLTGREGIERAVGELERLQDAMGEAAMRKLEADEAWGALADKAVAGLGERVDGLQRGLQRIVYEPVDIEMAQEIAKGSLDADDNAARLADELPQLKSEASARCTDARVALDKAKSQLNTAETLAARAPDLDLAQQDLEAAEQDARTADSEATSAGLKSEASQKRADEAELRSRVVLEQLATAESAKEKAETIARRAEPLATAEARIEELEPQLAAAQAELAEADGALAELGEEPVVPPAPDLEAARFQLRAAERAARDAAAAPPVREHALQQARESTARVGELEVERQALEAELANYAKLAADLGRNGLQAMEIDAAGGELTDLVNDYLHSCFGHRWTVSIETQRSSADGKKTIEGCDVRVIDTERGRDASAESLSGGERVIVSEAISLALTTVACRRSGVERPTIVRDETAAALDPERGRQYIQMLRRAADAIGVEKLLFVSHSPDVQDQADAQILISDGSVEVR